MKLSDLRDGQIGQTKSRHIFIVVSRDPEDRSSGQTVVQYEGGNRETFIWDYKDPEVRYLGDGYLETHIRFNDGTEATQSRY